MARTYYPGMLQLVGELNDYLTKHQSAMAVRLAISGSNFELQLNELVSAVDQIEQNWPDYREAQ